MAILARLGVNIAANIGFQYAAEMLPTVVRAQGVSLIHIIGYLAHIVGPYVIYLVSAYIPRRMYEKIRAAKSFHERDWRKSSWREVQDLNFIDWVIVDVLVSGRCRSVLAVDSTCPIVFCGRVSHPIVTGNFESGVARESARGQRFRHGAELLVDSLHIFVSVNIFDSNISHMNFFLAKIHLVMASWTDRLLLLRFAEPRNSKSQRGRKSRRRAWQTRPFIMAAFRQSTLPDYSGRAIAHSVKSTAFAESNVNTAAIREPRACVILDVKQVTWRERRLDACVVMRRNETDGASTK